MYLQGSWIIWSTKETGVFSLALQSHESLSELGRQEQNPPFQWKT